MNNKVYENLTGIFDYEKNTISKPENKKFTREWNIVTTLVKSSGNRLDIPIVPEIEDDEE